jgi:hypothetical protein
MTQIEQKREELYSITKDAPFTSQEVLRVSWELDTLLNEYQYMENVK